MRENLSKRLRFEVFKRDQFTCQYCGQRPPEVTLQVDHILAVANGGGNEPENLITSCQPCNSGKSDKPLTTALPRLSFSVEEQRERLEQVKAYQAFALKKHEAVIDAIGDLTEYWAKLEGQDFKDDRYLVEPRLEQALKRHFLNLLPIEEIMRAMDITFDKKRPYDPSAFRYFCGVCWKMLRDKEALKSAAPSAPKQTGGQPCM